MDQHYCRRSKRVRTRESVENDNKADGKRTRTEPAETDSESRSIKRTQAETDNSEDCGKRRSKRIKDSVSRRAETSSALGYTTIAMPEDGSCLFHSVGHGSYLRQGLDPPGNARAQLRLAAELRSLAVEELLKQREIVAPFVAGDLDKYADKMSKPQEWAGEQELLMLSSVLQMPITVYQFTCTRTETGPLVVAAEYGQEYMSTDQPPIQILYYSQREHYDVVKFHADQVDPAPETRPTTSRKFNKSATL